MDVDVRFGGVTIPTLLLAEDMVLLPLLNSHFQLVLGPFAVACEVARMRISNSKPEVLVLGWKRVDCPIRVRDK